MVVLDLLIVAMHGPVFEDCAIVKTRRVLPGCEITIESDEDGLNKYATFLLVAV